MNRVLLLTLVTAAVALAGCQEAADKIADGGDDAPPQQMTNAEAGTLLAQAADNMPESYGMSVAMSKDGAEVMTMDGAFDNAQEAAYFEITMDPSLMGEEAGSEEYAEIFAQGFAFYATKDGVVYLVNDTAFAFPASETGEGSFVPDPDETPFGDFLSPEETFGDLGENVTIESVRPITHKGKAAHEIQAVVRVGEQEDVNATIVVYANPARLARMEMDVPETEEDETLAGAKVVMELLYDQEVELEVPERATRAAGLAYDGGGFDFSGEGGPTTWTFSGSAGIPLDEVEAQVKDISQADEDMGSSPDSLSKLPTLWSMALSEGTKTEGGVTLTFTDADGNGQVSAGDTLSITSDDENGIPPQVILFDTVTETYVVPGPGLLALLAGLAVVAVALRRR